MFGLKKAKERQRAMEERADRMNAEYRRTHLIGAARFAVATDQKGPVFHGGGTVTTSKEELERVLGDDWREQYGKPRTHTPGTMGTASVWQASLD